MYGESSWLSTQQPVKMKKNKCGKNIFGQSKRIPMHLPNSFQTQTLRLQKNKPEIIPGLVFSYNYWEFLILAVIQ